MTHDGRHLGALKKLVLDSLAEEPVKILLFGSRARGDNVVASDVDIGILPYGRLNKAKLTLLREKIEESPIPYKVEIVDISETSADFMEAVLGEAVTWKD